MKKRISFSKTLEESINEYKKKLDLGRNFVDYFLTVGLEPKIALNPWVYENSIQKLNATYKEYLSPKIINKFPSFDKKLIGFDESIIRHIFPLGFQIKEILNDFPVDLTMYLDETNRLCPVCENKLSSLSDSSKCPKCGQGKLKLENFLLID